jgi:DNA-binding MarR family transcriptional regulator
LSDYRYINVSSTTELISKLEEAGLATRARSLVDNRIVEVALTESGRALAETTELGGIPLLRERLKRLSAEELEDVAGTFKKLNALLGLEDAP